MRQVARKGKLPIKSDYLRKKTKLQNINIAHSTNAFY